MHARYSWGCFAVKVLVEQVEAHSLHALRSVSGTRDQLMLGQGLAAKDAMQTLQYRNHLLHGAACADKVNIFTLYQLMPCIATSRPHGKASQAPPLSRPTHGLCRSANASSLVPVSNARATYPRASSALAPSTDTGRLGIQSGYNLATAAGLRL